MLHSHLQGWTPKLRVILTPCSLLVYSRLCIQAPYYEGRSDTDRTHIEFSRKQTSICSQVPSVEICAIPALQQIMKPWQNCVPGKILEHITSQGKKRERERASGSAGIDPGDIPDFQR
jgi:hypothetical protein